MTADQSLAQPPSHVPRELVRDFDFFGDRDLLDSPWDGYDRIHQLPEIFWTRASAGHGGAGEAGGFWVVRGYEAVREGFQRHDLFAAGLDDGTVANAPEVPVGIPLVVDPPDHHKYRQLLAPELSPGAVMDREETLRNVARTLIQDFVDTGRCEFMAAFARTFPAIAFLDLVGLPSDRHEEFLAWASAVLHPYDGESESEATAKIAEMLHETVENRTREPRADMLSRILGREVDGRPVTPSEAFSMMFLLFKAGLDTVTNQLGHIFRFLAVRDDVRRRLARDPDTLASQIEELLRFHSFISLPRRVKADTTFRGVGLRKGDIVFLPTAAANRDPSEFENPTEVDLERNARRHILFGAGPHRCVGSHLARLEVRIAIEEFHAAIPDYVLVSEGHVHGGVGMGYESLHLEWSPGRPRSETEEVA